MQPTGSFKHRGSGNALRALHDADGATAICTSSAGNFGQGLAWNARELNVPCSVIVPATVPQTKLDGLISFGANIHKVHFKWHPL